VEFACLCETLTCVVKGDNIEISCNKCKKTIVIKTKDIKEAVERIIYANEPFILNLKR